MTVTELIADQARTFAVMAGCGVLVESFRQIRNLAKERIERRSVRAVAEVSFWTAAGAAVSAFLYYCAFGKISFHGAAGFFTGLLLWKKMCCVIINAWVNAGEAENSKITARSSIWSRPGRKGWKRDGRRGSGKRRRLRKLPDARREEKWLSEEAATDGD